MNPLRSRFCTNPQRLPVCLLAVTLAVSLLSSGCALRRAQDASVPVSWETPASSVPSDWERIEDPSGFAVQIPHGWKVEAPEDKPILIYNEDRTAFAAIQPLIAQKDETASGLLRQVPQSLAALFPEAQMNELQERQQETDRTPGEATAEMPFVAGGVPMTANVQCSLYKRGGMFYAIAAPTAQFTQSRDTLVHVLSTFQFTRQPGSSTAAAPAQEWISWRDPNEGAFSLEVPKDWQVEGGMYRFHAIDTRGAIRVTSPDGSTTIFGGDRDVPPFCLPNVLLEEAGLHEGATYSVNGLNMTVKRFIPGADFAAEYVTQHEGRDYSGLTITSSRQRPDVTANINPLLATLAGGGTVQMDAGEVRYTCSVNGQPRQGYCFAATLLIQGNGNGMWAVPYLYGYLTLPDQTARAEGLLKHMVETFRIDAQWEAQQQNTTMNVSQITRKANEEIMKIWSSEQTRSDTVHDAIMRRWTNYIRGQETVYDPETNETWQVESGHNYYFARPTATEPVFTGNESGQLPDYRAHEVVIVH